METLAYVSILLIPTQEARFDNCSLMPAWRSDGYRRGQHYSRIRSERCDLAYNRHTLGRIATTGLPNRGRMMPVPAMSAVAASNVGGADLDAVAGASDPRFGSNRLRLACGRIAAPGRTNTRAVAKEMAEQTPTTEESVAFPGVFSRVLDHVNVLNTMLKEVPLYPVGSALPGNTAEIGGPHEVSIDSVEPGDPDELVMANFPLPSQLTVIVPVKTPRETVNTADPLVHVALKT